MTAQGNEVLLRDATVTPQIQNGTVRVAIPGLSFPRNVNMGKSLNCSEPQSHYRTNLEAGYRPNFIGLLSRFSGIIPTAN